MMKYNVRWNRRVGVYGSYNGGESWFPHRYRFPKYLRYGFTILYRYTTVPNTLILRASTHGRSMWEVDVPAEVIANRDYSAYWRRKLLTGTTRHLSWYGFSLR
ncbi:MAG: hypothetical protein IPM69_20010 [Ignavibacteria bacterium]|nr:hypothetical protein [Ignavibacteria bacterium]